MIDFKLQIAKQISNITNIPEKEIYNYIEVPKDIKNGDYAFPCFKLAKSLKKSPQIIAKDIEERIKIEDKIFNKIEIAGGYLNFFVNKVTKTMEVLQELEKNKEYGKESLGEGKNIIIEYSSPNIAKPFHIGHLGTTGIGHALYNIYKYLGYHVIRNKSFGGLWYSIRKNDRRL